MRCWFDQSTLHKTTTNQRLLVILGFLLAGCGSVAAEKPGQSINTLGTGGRPAIVIGDDAPVVATLWDGAEYGYVRIENTEQPTQTANDHPIAFTPQQIRAAFNELQVQRGEKDPKPLFTEQGLNDIAEPIAMALSRVRPDQDVTFAVTGKQGQGVFTLFGERLVTTGRVFYQDDQLNIILGSVQDEFEDTLRATGILRNFTPGSRTGPITSTDLKVQPVEGMQYASAQREDWLQLAPYTWSEKPAKSAQELAPAGVPVAPVASDRSTKQPSDHSAITTPESNLTASPDTPVSTSSTTPPPPIGSAAATSTMASGDDDYYQQFEKRFKTLRKLRDHDVITEKEYQERRRAILGEL